jgi:hypothetical protein
VCGCVDIQHSTFERELRHKHKQEERIKVCVRKRPLFPKEAEKGDSDVLVTDNNMRLQVLEPKVKVDLTKYTEEHDFFFDEVLDETASNQQVCGVRFLGCVHVCLYIRMRTRFICCITPGV